MKRILVAWIGHTDLMAMVGGLPANQQEAAIEALNARRPGNVKHGPLKTLLQHEAFDEVHLLSNYPTKLNRLFSKWIDCKPKIHAVELENPTDYSQVFRVSNDVLLSVMANRDSARNCLCIHLSPGTPAMTAIWVLLGKSRFPAVFYQTHEGKAWVEDVPFDLAFDFVPELLREPDSSFQHLASQSPKEIKGFHGIVGDSKAIRYAAGRASKAALRDVPVLILGETGTGKEMFARAIHETSHRKEKPFFAVNCAAIPQDLLESQLFGYKKGAFTGADRDRRGLFEEADGGTLFLDEIGECPTTLQAKLLRVLQPPHGEHPCHRVFTPVGATEDKASNVRIIAATNRNLVEEVRQGRFREDLQYRLAVITIKLPPLRERKSDIILIAESLLDQINREFRLQEPGYEDKSISSSAKSFVKSHSWPGNVRQLYNALVQAAVMAEGDVLQRCDIESALGDMAPDEFSGVLDRELGDGFRLQNLLEDIQRHYLQRAMEESGNVKKHAAKLLGMDNYQTLDAQLKRLGVKVNRKMRT